MKAGVIFTGTDPIFILTSYKSLTDPGFVEKLVTKGVKKLISYEFPLEEIKEKYGKYFDVIMNDLYQTDDLRVLDYNGHSIFQSFSFSKSGPPTYYEP